MPSSGETGGAEAAAAEALAAHHFLWKLFTKDFENKPTKVALHSAVGKPVGTCREFEQELMYSV